MFVTQDNILGTVDLYLPDNAGGGPYSLVGTNREKMGRASYPGMILDGLDPLFGGAKFIYAQVAPIAAQTVSSVTVSAGVATVTTSSAHGLIVGQPVQLAGFVPSNYNGIWQIASVPSSTTFTINYATMFDQRWSPTNPTFVSTLAANTNIPTASATTIGTYIPGIGSGQTVQFTHVADSFGNLILQAQLWQGAANSGVELGVALGNPLALTTTSNPTNKFGGQYAWFQIGGAAVAYVSGTPAIGNSVYYSSNGVLKATATASKQVLAMQFASAAGASFGSGTSGAITLSSAMAVVFGNFYHAQGAIT